MLFGLRRGVGEAAAMGCLGLYAKPSLPRKPMAGKGSLWSGKRSLALRFGLIPSQGEEAKAKERKREREAANLPVPGCGFQRPHHVSGGEEEKSGWYDVDLREETTVGRGG
jgi:hypothetical protein